MAKSSAKNKPVKKAKPAQKAKATAVKAKTSVKAKAKAKPLPVKSQASKSGRAAGKKSAAPKPKVVISKVKPAGKAKPTGSKSKPIVIKAKAATKPVKATSSVKSPAKGKTPASKGKPQPKATAPRSNKAESLARPVPQAPKPPVKTAPKSKAQPAKSVPAKKTKGAKQAARQNAPAAEKINPVVERAKAILAKMTPGRAKPKPRAPEGKEMRPSTENTGVERTRYSDDELQEFRDLINAKLEKARSELAYQQNSIKSPGENATDDSFSANKLMEDNSMSTEKEHMSQLAERMRKFVKNLEDALVRIENKTYGICKVTGKLINKDRLRAVPHTTMSMEAKLKQSK